MKMILIACCPLSLFTWQLAWQRRGMYGDVIIPTTRCVLSSKRWSPSLLDLHTSINYSFMQDTHSRFCQQCFCSHHANTITWGNISIFKQAVEGTSEFLHIEVG